MLVSEYFNGDYKKLREFENGEQYRALYLQSDMRNCGKSGHKLIYIGRLQIGERLYGQTSQLSNVIVVLVQYGFFDVKQNMKNMQQKIYTVNANLIMHQY